jgi:hypothetical protein
MHLLIHFDYNTCCQYTSEELFYRYVQTQYANIWSENFVSVAEVN